MTIRCALSTPASVPMTCTVSIQANSDRVLKCNKTQRCGYWAQSAKHRTDRCNLPNYSPKCRELQQILFRILYELTVNANTTKRSSVCEQQQLLVLAKVLYFIRSLELRLEVTFVVGGTFEWSRTRIQRSLNFVFEHPVEWLTLHAVAQRNRCSSLHPVPRGAWM